MDVFTFRKIIEECEGSPERINFLKDCKKGEAYFENKNDITKTPARSISSETANPLKTSNNRIAHYWHGLMVMQKISYLFGKVPVIDVGNSERNEQIKKVLGDEFQKTLMELTRHASNKGKAWLHIWKDKDENFNYAVVPSEEIIPIYSEDLKKRLKAVIRIYAKINLQGKEYKVYEYWDNKQCYFFEDRGLGIVSSNVQNYEHGFKDVPFIYFQNNSIGKGDLFMYKSSIDAFDKEFSEFMNDIDDVQQIIFVLEGYGGEDLEEFMKDLKEFKAVKTDDKGDVRTVRAEIPVEARREFLLECKKSIFLFGMGVNPDRENFGDSSGVALKFMYSLLELKAAATRIEFDCSLKVLVRRILETLGADEELAINITYYKNMITNDLEIVSVLSNSGDTISAKTKTKKHPYTENLDEELKLIEAEKGEADYNFGKEVNGDEYK